MKKLKIQKTRTFSEENFSKVVIEISKLELQINPGTFVLAKTHKISWRIDAEGSQGLKRVRNTNFSESVIFFWTFSSLKNL